MNSKSQELADASVKAIKDFVDRSLAQRLDRHLASIEALERRIAALERKAGPKAAPVILNRARDR